VVKDITGTTGAASANLVEQVALSALLAKSVCSVNKITWKPSEVHVGARVRHLMMELALVSALKANTGTHGATNVKIAALNAMIAIIGAPARKILVEMVTKCLKDTAAACQAIMDQIKFAYLRKTRSSAMIVSSITKTYVGTVL